MRTEDPSSDGPLDLPEAVISDADFVRAFDVAPADVFNTDTWNNGADLAGLSAHLNREIEEAQRIHDHTRDAIRDVIFPRLKESPFAPSSVGLFQATAEEIEKAARTQLFAGGVEAVDGTRIVIDMLPLTTIQIGVVSYVIQLAAERVRAQDVHEHIDNRPHGWQTFGLRYS
jgi:hypothetical protein